MSSRNRERWNAIYEEWKLHHQTSKAKRRHIVRGCNGKFAYPHFLMAMMAAVKVNAELGYRCHPYWCDICKHHHIGNAKSKPIFPKELRESPTYPATPPAEP